MQAVDIPNRTVTQYPSLGVRTKNKKYAITNLLDIPELLKVIQEWDNDIRPLLPPDGLWFAPLSPETGQIDPKVTSAGEHRPTLARRNMKEWIERVGLPYHSPHKFRHGHIHYGADRAQNISDFKAISMNVMHASMEITDEFYSVLSDGDVQNRISSLGKQPESLDEDELQQFKLFLDWKKKQGKK